jgi:ATP-dependent DNA helicase 2 subunit 1
MLTVRESVDEDRSVKKKKKPDSSPASAVRTALDCAYAILQSRIISNPNDKMGILLFGTENTHFSTDRNENSSTSGGFEHCYLLMDLDIPDAAAIKQLKDVLNDDEKFESILGLPQGSKMVSMANVLFAVNQIFTTKAANFQSRKLFLITDDDDPHSDNRALKNSAVTRARDLYDLGVQIVPFFFSNPEQGKFNPRKFYDDIIYHSPDEDEGDGDGLPFELVGSGSTRLKEMVSTIRSKATAKRALFTSKFDIGPGLRIGVKGYIPFKKQEKARRHYVYMGDEKPKIVTGVTTTVVEETAQVLVEKAQIRKAYRFGGEQIVFSEEEMKEMRKLEEETPIIRVIGFKPQSALQYDHNIKPATFIYPDEKEFIGSTRTFTALHSKLQNDGKIGLVWAVVRRNMSPVLCALYPSQEIVDPNSGLQIQPPGFFLTQLPFADDVRSNPEISTARATTSLIDAMRQVVKQLHLPNGYEPEKYQNPSLQWHYRILQAIALDEDLPDQPIDMTIPKYRLINKHVGPYVLVWGKILEEQGDYGTGFVTAKDTKKRGNDEGEAGALKKRKMAGSTVGEGADEIRQAYENGTLAKLKVTELKEFLKSVRLDISGKKAELIKRCEEHFDRK